MTAPVDDRLTSHSSGPSKSCAFCRPLNSYVSLKMKNQKKEQRYKIGRCVHCLEQSNEINDDHIFPSAWYPDDTPGTVERWTIPCCVKCNREHGANEQELLIRMGLCISPKDVRATGVAFRALRSISPQSGKNNRDKSARQMKRVTILKDIEVVKNSPVFGIFPNFGADPTIHYDDYTVINVPAGGLIKLGEKIVRGLTYHFERRFIEKEKEQIDIFFLQDQDAAEIVNLAKRYGESIHRGPGILVTRAVTTDDTRAAIFIIEIWGRLKVYALLQPKRNDLS